MSSVKAKPAQGALWNRQEATPELHIPAAVRETPEEKWVCAVMCFRDAVQGISHPKEFIIQEELVSTAGISASLDFFFKDEDSPQAAYCVIEYILNSV